VQAVSTRRKLGATLMAAGGILVAVSVAGATLLGNDVEEGAASSAPSPPDPTISADVQPTESAADFVTALLQAIADRDSEFLLARLAEATYDRYGTDQCERFFSNLEDPTESFEVRAGGAPRPFEYVTDGVSRTIEEAVPVEIARVINGETIIQEQHVTRAADGTFRFYSDCGKPIEGAR
jgi:hypothetical protein